jgi:hypothetical protein
MTKISIINRSTVISDADVQKITAALQKQVTNDWAPVWGSDATLQFVGQKATPSADSWWLTVLDDSDQAGALGYHDLTTTGLPLGKAFAKSDIQDGFQPSVTISHELLEMLGDPDINLSAQVGNRIYAYEVCDPCEADELGYDIDGVLVSDFVTPDWFQPIAQPSGPYDFQERIQAPLTLAKGGYLQYLELAAGSGWQQVTESKKPMAKLRARPGSRRERRRVGHAVWQRSEPTR